MMSWQSLVAHWRAEFHVYHAADADSAAIRARHMQSIGRLTPLTMLGNLVGALLLASTLLGTVPGWQLALWLAALLLACGGAMHNWSHNRRQPRPMVSPKAIDRTVRGAFLLGALWGGATLAWLPDLAHDQQLLLATLVVGMMCGGAFALASVPQAAAAYLTVMAAGSVIGLARAGGAAHGHLILMVILYALLLGGCVFTNARIYTARLVSERETERQREWVGLLLRDFEQHSADLLWEIDAEGRFTRGSARLAAALANGSEALAADGLLGALALHAAPELPRQHQLDLAAAMAEGRAFRDLAVPVQTDRGLRWWSFTATPMRADSGRLAGWRGVMADVTPARRAQDRLEQLAHFDSLTGLANRLQLRERGMLVPGSVGGGDAITHRAALICLDVDHFKAINDTQGHVVGDAVLVEIARRLRSNLRAADLAVRMGGDEFALVIDPLLDDDQAHGLARRLVQVLGQPIEVAGQIVPLSVSVGVALAPDHGSTLDELLVNADLALYAAKEGGRGRYEFFSSRLGDRHRRKVQVAQALRGALARGEFMLNWQPQVHIGEWRVIGAEVLLRWQHPELGAVSPAEFIPVAEESGLIGEIGAWVLEQACIGAAQLPASVAVSVNASPVQLMREDFVPAVGLALGRSGLPAKRLKIEITESLFMDAAPVTLANLHGLRQLGVQIALDDFGTGFSSLAYLLRFPFDLLKIDRAFVLEMMARDDARALVRTIVEMARCLGMQTVAEGVEDTAQLEVLGEAGCDAVQGYLVARPMPLEQLHRLLHDWRERPAAAPDESGARQHIRLVGPTPPNLRALG